MGDALSVPFIVSWFLGICRLRLCRLILLQQSCCDIGDKVFNRNSSGQLTQKKSTIYLFNSLCKLVELVEQQSCCQKLLKNKPLSKEKEQSLGPLVKKPSKPHKPSTQLSKKSAAFQTCKTTFYRPHTFKLKSISGRALKIYDLLYSTLKQVKHNS